MVHGGVTARLVCRGSRARVSYASRSRLPVNWPALHSNHPEGQATRASCTAQRGTASSAVDRATSRRVIVSGIQPTGVPHLGNYLGALTSWVKLQQEAKNDDELYFFIAGLHALTLPQERTKLYADRRNLMATLIAIGLDPERCTIFQQDQVPEHAELGWMISCVAPFGKLERMTTWKSKLATLSGGADEAHSREKSLQLGLFAYPALQAADILLYHATHVPVGDDQVQHMELTRDLAVLMNKSLGQDYFTPPAYTITAAKRILSLRNPAQKMSKSAPDANSRILLTDSPEQVSAKVRRAVTDSDPHITYDPEARPGVSNLLSILAALGTGVLHERGEHPTPQAVADALARSTGGTSAALKKVLAESINATLAPIQAEYRRLTEEPAYLDAVEKLGREKASARAQATMAQVRQLLGVA